MSAPAATHARVSTAIMWAHAVTLLVICPVWAGYNLTAVSHGVGWAAFAVFAVAGAALVWRARNNWGRPR